MTAKHRSVSNVIWRIVAGRMRAASWTPLVQIQLRASAAYIIEPVRLLPARKCDRCVNGTVPKHVNDVTNAMSLVSSCCWACCRCL